MTPGAIRTLEDTCTVTSSTPPSLPLAQNPLGSPQLGTGKLQAVGGLTPPLIPGALTKSEPLSGSVK